MKSQLATYRSAERPSEIHSMRWGWDATNSCTSDVATMTTTAAGSSRRTRLA